MAKTDWRFTDTVIPEDLNGIGEEINGLRTEMSTRFDHEATTPLTLQSGLQVVHANKDARFKLGEIRGRTLVNLLGHMGSMDSLNGWRYDPDTAVLDSTDKIEGTASVKGIISNGQYSDIFYSFPYESNNRYVVLGELKTYGGATARIRMVESEGLVELSSPLLSSDIFSTVFFKVPLNAITSGNAVYFGAVFAGENGSGGNVDALRIYEISDAEYQALDGMTPEQVALKYPFVPSGIIGVENPYVITTSGNLLPPFYEWESARGAGVLEPYKFSLNGDGINGAYRKIFVPVIPGETYFFNIDTLGFEDYERPGVFFYFTTQKDPSKRTDNIRHFNENVFTVPEGVKFIEIFCSTDNGLAPESITQLVGSFTFTNPLLAICPAPETYQVQRKSMLAFQTELYGNPTDNSESDILFEQNGEYRKLAKWKKVVLNGELGFVLGGGKGPDYKQIIIPNADDYGLLKTVGLTGRSAMVKYNGKVLYESGTTNASLTSEDQYYFSMNPTFTRIYFTVSNTDSGWGDDYTPTQDEIKAYFMGWRMYLWGTDGGPQTPFNGTGTKGWGKIYVGVGGNNQGVVTGSGTTTLPTIFNDQGYTPYQLLYRLAKETVEPVVKEGSLLFCEGDNIVEVGTGMMLRERNLPVKSSTAAGINITSSINSALKHKAYQILIIYKNGETDYTWDIVTRTDGTAYGRQRAFIDISNYDQSAAYSVTYIKLDKSTMQPIIGTLASNEKTQISDLTAGVAEALQRVSVAEMKKAEKDAPGWITPSTLLNGAAQGGNPVRYKKLSNALVLLDGIFIPSGSNLTVFRLPENYRPKQYSRFPVICGTNTEFVSTYAAVQIDGNVVISSTVPLGWVSLTGVIFLAEI